MIVGVLAALTLLGCTGGEDVTWTQFNGPDDSLVIDVGVPDVEPATSVDLTSSTGEVLVGIATVDPGGGPLGTEHAVVVEIYDDYEDIVDRVSVRLSSETRGDDEFDLDQDSADEGVWKTTLVSVGTEGEVRQDTLTVRCWDRDGDDDGTDSSSSDTGG